MCMDVSTLNSFSEEFERDGFVVIQKYFDDDVIESAENAVQELSGSGDVDVYHDQDGNLRRMERFTLQHHSLMRINQKVVELLGAVTRRDQILFKDKYNFKPPGGEGFYAHYDGVFQFSDAEGNIRNGWSEYAPDFVSVLIALDPFTTENGALEIAPAKAGSFDSLLEDTVKNGSPNLREEVVAEANFSPLILEKGGLAVFKWSCPHRSGANRSTYSRGSLYWTYHDVAHGDNYERYFSDKHSSTNVSKALEGERA